MLYTILNNVMLQAYILGLRSGETFSCNATSVSIQFWSIAEALGMCCMFEFANIHLLLVRAV